jgi:hypothetical protein
MVLNRRYLDSISTRSRSERASGSITEGKTTSSFALSHLRAGVAQRTDRNVLWFYPVARAGAIAIATFLFL